jgi:tRNA(fMet)-specific endonuclease VapC
MYVLDTNTLLDYFRGKGDVGVNLLARPPSEIALPAVVAYEVWVGVLGSQNARRRQTQYEQFLTAVEVLPFDSVVARRAAELRHALELRGEGIGPLDTLIAATALVHNATLVTRNLREFGRVQGLRVIDWFGSPR